MPEPPISLRTWLSKRDPRRFKECSTCLDFGMVEDSSGREDTCPTCEGGIWRERESWRWFIHRQPWLGFRIDLIYHRIPRIRRDWPA